MTLDLVADRVPIAIRNAIAGKGGRLIVMAEVDHPDGYVRVWSGAGMLYYGGYGWLGVGTLGAIDGLGGSRKTQVRVVTLTLSGVDPAQLQFVTKQVRGRAALISLAALKPGTRAVDGDRYFVCTGKCDTQDHKLDTNHSASVVIAVNQPIFILARTLNLAWTADWLKSTYGSTIVGLDDLANLASTIVNWTP